MAESPALPRVHALVVCVCGAVVLPCACAAEHPTRTVEACGVCTATGGTPVVDEQAP